VLILGIGCRRRYGEETPPLRRARGLSRRNNDDDGDDNDDTDTVPSGPMALVGSRLSRLATTFSSWPLPFSVVRWMRECESARVSGWEEGARAALLPSYLLGEDHRLAKAWKLGRQAFDRCLRALLHQLLLQARNVHVEMQVHAIDAANLDLDLGHLGGGRWSGLGWRLQIHVAQAARRSVERSLLRSDWQQRRTYCELIKEPMQARSVLLQEAVERHHVVLLSTKLDAVGEILQDLGH